MQVKGGGKWTAVAAGDEHTVGIKKDGTLWAWGDNDDGRLGNGKYGDNEKEPSPVQVRGEWTAVAAGGWHTVGIKKDGTLWAWGKNYNGQLGNGTSGYREKETSPVQVKGGGEWTAVAAGSYHTVGIKKDGTLWAWGKNEYAQLGNGKSGGYVTSPVQVRGGGEWTAVAAGTRHTVGIKKGGTLWAWGRNRYGQLGNGKSGEDEGEPTPVQVKDGGEWTAVAAGNNYTVGIYKNGTLWAWGNNEYGQLGNGTSGRREKEHIHVQVKGGGEWTAVAAGNNYTVGIKKGGSLWAWGNNDESQLGNGTSGGTEPSPVQVKGGGKWTAVATGSAGDDDYTVGIKKDGSLWAWGSNGYGQLGNGKSGRREKEPRPVLVIE